MLGGVMVAPSPASAAGAIGAYVAILALWALVLRVGGKPTLWKGRALLISNAVFVAITGVVLLARGQRPGVALAAFLVLLLIVGIAVRGVWLLLNIDRAGVAQVVEKCLAQTRANYDLRDGRYLVRTTTEDLAIDIGEATLAIRVRFTGGSGSKKAELIRSLLGKQFKGSVPTLRVRT